MRVNGTELHVEDSGGDGPPILFMHGLLWSTRMFAPQIERLKPKYRCIAYDHRNQGKSAPDAAPVVGIETCTDDALALLDVLGIESCHLVGLSMGGFVAMRLAARHPGRTKKLVLIETSAEPEPPENVPKYEKMILVARVFGLRPLVGRVMPIMFGRSFLTDPAREADRKVWRAELSGNARGIVRSVRGVIERSPIESELGNVRAPTMVIVGDEDVATVPAKAERIVSRIAGATLVRVARAGHTSTIEAPGPVSDAIEQFLAAPGGLRP